MKPSPKPQPIGQNADGTYIYESAQNMSVMPPKQFTPITSASTGIPNVGIPGVKGLTTPIVPSATKGLPGVSFSPERAKTINAPVKDTLKINERIDNESERTKLLRQHFDYLQEKGELMLNNKQSEYIKRVKQQYPDYKTVPDAILYGKMILADEKLMEKYGNIGDKSALRRFQDATV